MSSLWRITVKSCVSATVCAGAAVLLSALMNSGWEFRVVAPMICLQAVIVVSLFWGRLPGLVGAVAASLTFAIWLFPPIGSFAIHDPADRVILLLFQLAGLTIVLLSPRTPVGVTMLGSRPYRLLSRQIYKRRNKISG